MKKTYLFTITLIALMLMQVNQLFAAETANSPTMIWAHITPWFQATDNSLFTDWYYNYPLHRAKNTPDSRDITMREDILNALDKGIDGFFIDIGAEVRAKREFSWAWTMPAYLKAAEGTPFQVGICLDGPFTPEYLGEYVPKMLKQFGDHPNYPKYNGKYVVCTYQFRRLSAADWAKARELIKAKGYNIFLMANLAPRPGQKADTKLYDAYKDVVDSIYFFDSPAHADQHPNETNKILNDWCKKNNKLYVATIHPGYYGAWKFSNDFYNPFRGFDAFYATIKAAKKQNAKWIHVTTWNDLMETALLERAYTFGITETLKYYNSYLKGKEIVKNTPEVLLAYHREELPGTILRIEACNLPSKCKEVTISGSLINFNGKKVAALAPKKVTGNKLGFVEWLFASEKFAYSPYLIPEITVKSENYSRKVQFPAIRFVSSYLENATTINLPVNGMLENFDNSLSIKQNDNILTAEISFKHDTKFDRIVLFKNDSPIAVFNPDYKSDEVILTTQMWKPHLDAVITVENGKVLRSVKKSESNNQRPHYSWTPDKIMTRWRGEHGITFIGKKDMVIIVAYEKGQTFQFSALDLIQKRSIHDGIASWNAKQEMTMLNDEPINIAEGKLSLNVFNRDVRESDSYFVRYETTDGKVHLTPAIYPFANGNPTVKTKILRTAVNMETTAGHGGIAFIGVNEFLTPKSQIPVQKDSVVTAEVSKLIERASLWKFEDNGADSLGEYSIGGLKSDMFIADNSEYGKSLKFTGKGKIMLPRRHWNLSGFGTISFDIKPNSVGGAKRQTLIHKDGRYDGFSMNLMPDGTIEVIRSHGVGESTQNTGENFISTEKIKVNEWNNIKIVADAEYMQIFINGKASQKFKLLPLRTYGSGLVHLGGGYWKADNYTGLIDNLCIKGF
ncbi:MAG: hypothetical protein IJW31_02865 [Lentisphaeria bacterium]|nr:hypothetical protein [Lentisphaeria bacterium]